ncbi:MAG: Maf family protein [Alphaproteobacteria bacterium]|nr:Maf family protein [Alphaproteobacteria bacterium]
MPGEIAPERLVLASGSTSRAGLLRAAGLRFAVDPAGIDEEAIKIRYRGIPAAAADCAAALAEAKAQAVCQRHPGALVLGADQILVAGERWYDKPADLACARDQLRRLRGRVHRLATAACIVADGTCLWHALSEPRLTMRAFSETFVESYLAAEGEAVLGSVGSYRLEARGAQLFSRVEGDYFAILGLPLFELFDFLRRRGILAD